MCQISVKKTKRLSIPNTKIGHKEVLTGFFVYIYLYINQQQMRQKMLS